jgi:A/G-specific adenine glycosylase
VHDLNVGRVDMTQASLVASFDPVVHVFTHLRLTMHAYYYRIDAGALEDDLVCDGMPARKWVDAGNMDGETLSTGMRKCWDLVAKA